MKKKITIRNILAVMQYLWRKVRDIAGFPLPQYMYEQIIWRRTQVMEKSPECWREGHCKICGCEILGKTMEDRACGMSEVDPLKQCYPEMMTEDEWRVFKLNNQIKLFD